MIQNKNIGFYVWMKHEKQFEGGLCELQWQRGVVRQYTLDKLFKALLIEYDDVETEGLKIESEIAAILVPSSRFYLCLNLAEMVVRDLAYVELFCWVFLSWLVSRIGFCSIGMDFHCWFHNLFQHEFAQGNTQWS